MTVETDVRAKNITATGAAAIGRVRIRGLYWIAVSTAGSISIRSGGAGGPEVLKLDTPTGTVTGQIQLPSDGILFDRDPYVTLTNVTSVTLFYG